MPDGIFIGSQSCTQVPGGLVNWWPGDGDADDIIGAKHGTLHNGATFAPGNVEQAFSFDGVNDRVESVPTTVMNTLPLTVEAWVKPELRNDANFSAFLGFAGGFPNNVISNDKPSQAGHGFGVNIISSSSFLIVEYQQGFRLVPGASFQAGQWYHVAVIYTPGNFKAYVNGQLVDDFDFIQEVLDGENVVRIGNHNGDPQYGTRDVFKGQIDEVGIYNRDLAASEVQAIFDAGSAGKCKPQCAPSPSSMVSWWPGDGDANDSQGNNNGTLQNGATFADGKVGQAFSFDGINDYVQTPLDVQPSAMPETTWEAWVYPTRVNHSVRQQFLSDDDANHDRSVLIESNTSNFGVFTGSGVWQPTSVDVNQWQHIAVVYTPTNIKFYKNGVEYVRGSAPTGQVTVNRLRIGSNPWSGNGEYYRGLIDEPSVFNRSLTQSEIQAIYNAGSAGKCPPGSLASLTLNPPIVTGGQTSTGTITLINPAPAGGAAVNLSSSDTNVATVPSSVTLAEGDISESFTITTGTVTTISTVDISATYDGDTRTATLTVTPQLPDLQVSVLNAPSQTLTDDAFDISWTDANRGQGRANGSWVDRVFLSGDNQIGNDTPLAEFPFSQFLDPDQSRDRIQTVSIPRSAVPADGPYFLIVVTDANDNVDEGSGENNNWLARPITVRRAPLPDLTVEAIEAPGISYFDQTITVRWTIKNGGNASTDASEWADRLYLSSDRGLSGDDVRLTDVLNASYLGVGESYLASADVRIPRGLFGMYYVIVKTDINNAVLEDNEDNNSTRGKAIDLEIPQLPDLQVTLVQGPEEAFTGEPMLLNWRVENQGTGNTPPDQSVWTDGIYLSKDQTFDPAIDRLIGGRRREGGLAKDDGYTVSGFSVDVPRDIAGGWYVFIWADHQNGVYEFTKESNNTKHDDRRPVSIRATPPDLIVESFTAPDTGTAARQVTVNWTVKNQGPYEAKPSWADTVYLSPDVMLDPATDRALASVSRTSILEPGGSYSASATVTLTACAAGTYYLYVAADSRNQLFEFDPTQDAEQNNLSQPQAVVITPLPPDLQVPAVTNPTVGNAGQPIQVSWTVANRGVGPTVEGSWVDRVYLSPTPTFNAGTALLAGSFTHSGNIAQNGFVTHTENVIVPTRAQGPYYVFVWTDALGAVEECGGENDNVGPGAASINVNNDLPDLTVTSAGAPTSALAGQTITVQWTASNTGTTGARNSAWNDAVYFSTNAIFDGGDRRLATRLINGPVEVGTSYSAQAQATIPIVSAGTYYLIIKADVDDYVFEGQREDNNTGYAIVAVTLPDVDLQVQAVDAPAEAFSGQEMIVNWTVINVGSMPTFAAQWTDYVIISRDRILDPTDRTIGYKVHNGELGGGGSYNETLEATVPAGLTGPYYVFVRTDRNNQVAEANKDNNAGVAANAATLQLPPPVDLTVTAIEAPASGSPGERATIRWTVRNDGPNTAFGRWQDAVYLSKDQAWDINDALVGRFDTVVSPITAGQTYAGVLTTELPAVDPSSYYVIVRTDVRNRVREVDETNNTAVSTGTAAVDVTELQLGVPQNSTLQTGQERYYKVNAPGNETLLFTLDGQNPLTSNELFVRYGMMPSRSAFDYLFNNPYAPDQEIVVPNTFEGFYYSLARAVYVPSSGGGGGVTTTDPFSIKAEIVPFSIRSVSPNRIGDNGQVTITIEGAKFSDGTQVKIVKGATTLTPTEVWAVDSATLKARFFLTNAPHDTYDVMLTNPGNDSTTLSQVLTIEPATGMRVTLDATGNFRPVIGRVMRLDGIVANTGNVDAQYVQITGEYTGRVAIGWARPPIALPSERTLPPASWSVKSPTAASSDLISLDGFYLRDLEPGANIPLSFFVREYSREIAYVELYALPITAMDYINGQRALFEGIRQVYVNNPDIELPAEWRPIVDNPETWWQYFARVLRENGLIDDVGEKSRLQSSIQPLFLPIDRCPINDICYKECKERAVRLIRIYKAACIDEGGSQSECAAQLPQIAASLVAGCKKTCSMCFPRPPMPPGPHPAPSPGGGPGGGGGGETNGGSGGGTGGTVIPANPADPNDKEGTSGFGPQGFISPSQFAPYRINFENITSATAAAQRIRVEDYLNQNLDLRTFRLKEIGFGKYRIAIPENRAFFQGRVQLGEDLGNLLADISTGLDIATGQVTWTLTAIDPKTGEQPNSALLGLLPPNDDTGRGQGFVTYTIQPKAGAPTGTQISNNATIIFDTEEPIITNTVTNTLDAGVPVSAIAQLPASSPPTFTVSWAGDDPADGSGLQSNDIFVSESDGPYQPFLSGTTETSAPFTGQSGGTYRFYSVARDNAGNVEAAPTTPDVVTTVDQAENTAPTLTGLSPNSAAAGGPQFTLIITGANFISGAMAHWSGSPRPTTYVSPTQLTSAITAADIAAEGTANVTVVNPASGGTSNAVAFAITSATVRDVSGLTSLTRGGFRYNGATGRFVQTMTITNTGDGTITAPVALVLDDLSGNAALFNKDGDTSCLPTLGSPFINVNLGADGVLSPGETATVTLEFTNPTKQSITYTTRVLAGAGCR